MKFSILLQRILDEARWYEEEVTIDGIFSVMFTLCGIPENTMPLGKKRNTKGVITKELSRRLEGCTNEVIIDVSHVIDSFRDSRENKDTPIARMVCRDLVTEARAGKLDPVIGRETELDSLIYCLLRRKKGNAIITGTAGVGKTALVEKLAQCIASGDVPKPLERVPVYLLDVMQLASMKCEAAKALLDEFDRSNIILFIDEIHLLMDHRYREIAELLKPVLSRGQFSCIGATTREEYVRCLSQDAAFRRRFEKIDLIELGEEETMAVLRGLTPIYEKEYHVSIGEDVIRSIVSFSKRYLPGVMPDKCIDILERMCTRAFIRPEKTVNHLKDNDFISYYHKSRKVSHTTHKTTLDDVRHTVEVATGIRSTCDITHEELMARLHENIVGMDEQIESVVSCMVKAHNVHRESGALGSMLFMGEEGTGKEFMARSLCRSMFGSEHAFLHINMAYYADHYNVSKLVGSPPGYIGHEAGGGLLSKFVRDHPMGIIFLDNLSADSGSVAMTIFKDAVENGKISDASGMEIDFRNHIFIGSYVGGSTTLGFQGKQIFQKPPAGTFLRPMIPFRKSTAEEKEKIIKQYISVLSERLKTKGIRLSVTKGVYDWLVSHSEGVNDAILNIDTCITDRIDYRDKNLRFVIRQGRIDIAGRKAGK